MQFLNAFALLDRLKMKPCVHRRQRDPAWDLRRSRLDAQRLARESSLADRDRGPDDTRSSAMTWRVSSSSAASGARASCEPTNTVASRCCAGARAVACCVWAAALPPFAAASGGHSMAAAARWAPSRTGSRRTRW